MTRRSKGQGWNADETSRFLSGEEEHHGEND